MYLYKISVCTTLCLKKLNDEDTFCFDCPCFNLFLRSKSSVNLLFSLICLRFDYLNSQPKLCFFFFFPSFSIKVGQILFTEQRDSCS